MESENIVGKDSQDTRAYFFTVWMEFRTKQASMFLTPLRLGSARNIQKDSFGLKWALINCREDVGWRVLILASLSFNCLQRSKISVDFFNKILNLTDQLGLILKLCQMSESPVSKTSEIHHCKTRTKPIAAQATHYKKHEKAVRGAIFI